MPIYTYRCIECGNIQDGYRPIAARNVCPTCSKCGAETEKAIVPTHVAPQMPEYQCPVTGEVVHSKKRRREIMAKHNLVEKG